MDKKVSHEATREALETIRKKIQENLMEGRYKVTQAENEKYHRWWTFYFKMSPFDRLTDGDWNMGISYDRETEKIDYLSCFMRLALQGQDNEQEYIEVMRNEVRREMTKKMQDARQQ